MKHLLLATVLLALPTLASSQAIPFEQSPMVSVTGSATYLFGEAQAGHNHNLWGWTITPEVNLTHRFGMQMDVSRLTENSVYPVQHRLILTAGPRYNFMPVFHSRPFIYAEAGEMRETYEGYPSNRNWDPVGKLGFGFDYHLTKNVSLNIVPAEYFAHNLDWGGWVSDYSARFGFTLNFYAKPPRVR
jgi:hypothetical protein